MLEFEILAQGLYRADQLSIAYDPTLRMPATPALRAELATRWQTQLKLAHERGTPLFDASLFRLIDASDEGDGTLRLTLGDTSYQEYVTTFQSPTNGASKEHESQHSHPLFSILIPPKMFGDKVLSNALAVCSVIETSDGYILLDKRQGVNVYVGRYHVIGGFFERNLDMVTLPDPFAAICREIREETGIQSADISEQYCLCLVYDLTTPHAELCFLTRLHIPLATVLTRTPEDDEVKQLEALQVTAASLRAFILQHHGNISATGEPNLLSYGAWKFGEAWYNEILEHLIT